MYELRLHLEVLFLRPFPFEYEVSPNFLQELYVLDVFHKLHLLLLFPRYQLLLMIRCPMLIICCFPVVLMAGFFAYRQLIKSLLQTISVNGVEPIHQLLVRIAHSLVGCIHHQDPLRNRFQCLLEYFISLYSSCLREICMIGYDLVFHGVEVDNLLEELVVQPWVKHIRAKYASHHKVTFHCAAFYNINH